MDAKKQKEFDELPEEEKKKIIEEKETAKRELMNRVYIEPKILDNEDGSYLVKYKVPEECKCEVDIFFLEDGKEQAIRGSKFTSSFVAKGNPKTSNEFDGPIMQTYLTSQIAEISRFL